MYTNVDGSNLNLRLYNGGSCATDCTTDCSDHCTKYCNAAKNDTESHKTRINDLMKQAKDLQEKLKSLGNNFKVIDYGGRRKTRKRGGFFATNSACEEKCKSTCKTNCNILCENAMEEFSDQMKKVKKEISILNELISKIKQTSSSRQPTSSYNDEIFRRLFASDKEKEERKRQEKKP